ncbi:SDR family NAD(P)-dependent oxidoreductase [Glaciimonas sp. Gout2]|uniref:SDR family NAD(P)-dependent oxidoreductase n=1 Tax=unclassified Glaciimonas TaxID=2644401 RepID=UPI002AB35ADD|nr:MULTISPECIES: SDR family NAD(P)-dependent oxidoreductase [unclassified Glaciimonas]MDY7548652.1 SDR family NAD(P)-dependent oxidoreductase [Glaciimonas sp. CA11.2]MEB0014037.1 SDR family NAD(P)-dependent oxidoreductase [Glaciimonas sp. Cout2]MEB0084211.1 SDR family NAD(P)-dependent oxidoreductase [Glaciimonas sp. Gout2]
MKLYNKVAIVTGAQRGIGLAIAQRFMREAHTLLLLTSLMQQSRFPRCRSKGNIKCVL